jgi:PAS domain S-box-containing protein
MNCGVDMEGFARLFDNIPEGVIVTDSGKSILFMNGAAAALTGWSSAEAVGKPLNEVFHVSGDKVKDPAKDAIESRATTDMGFFVPLLAKNGTQRMICGSCSPIYSDRETVQGAILIFRESTACKQDADASRMSEEKYKSIVEHSHDVIMLTQPDGIISYISPVCMEVLGWAPEDLIGKQPWIIHPDDLVKVKEAHYRALRGESGSNYEYRIRTRIGAMKWVSHSWSPELRDGKVQTIVSIIRDITEQKNAEEEIKEALSRFEAVIENTPLVAIQGFNREGVIRHWNAACTHLYGFTAEEAIGKRLQDILLSGDTAKEFMQILKDIWDSGKARKPQEWSVQTRSGEERWVYSTMFPIFEHGAVSEVFCMDMDITARKRAEEEVRFARDRAQSYLDLAGVMFIALNTSGNITMINRMGCKVLGYEERELLGRNWFDTCLAGKLRAEVKDVFLKFVSGEIEPVEYFENSVVTKNGDERIVEWHNAVIRDETGCIMGTLSSGMDITERKRAQEQLFEARKMETVATLAGGVAHDFNNLMAAILGHVSLVRKEFEGRSSADKSLSVIEESASHAGGLARQLLAYAREGKYEPQVLNLNEIVHDAFLVCKHFIPPNVLLELDIEPSLPDILADPTQMRQVVTNLCTNAVEAMPEGGQIRCRTRGVQFVKEDPKLPQELVPGSYVSLTMQDTGRGMDKETLAGIFDPFFTTKFVGRGLGLAAAHGIVINHGGIITVESEVGQGATFTVYLPATKEKSEKNRKRKAGASRGSETILIIDDEPSILSVTERIFRRYGYHTLLAAGGEEALELAQNYRGTIHLALLDLNMPGLSGIEIFPRLAALRPDMKVLISTGYALDQPARKLLDAGAKGFIEKPYKMENLARKVREILDGGQKTGSFEIPKGGV